LRDLIGRHRMLHFLNRVEVHRFASVSRLVRGRLGEVSSRAGDGSIT
jgi:hypothetical protein